MEIKRCHPGDLRDILRIFKDESVFPHITDDMTSDPDSMDTKILGALHNMSVYFLMPRVNTVIMFIPTNSILYDVHVASIKGGGRRFAGDDAYNCLRWMMDNTEARKFTTMVPGFNRAGVLFARRCGMRKEGTITKSYLKDGTLYDLEIYGVTEEQVLAKEK